MVDLKAISAECERELSGVFAALDSVSQECTEKVLKAFEKLRLAETHFAPSTGYGYNDEGRDVCEKIFAEVFGTEEAIVRHNIISGTHAISIGLFGLLRPGDTMLSVTGMPYDTIEPVIGIKPAAGSLAEYGVKFDKIDMVNGRVDIEAVKKYLLNDKTVKMVYIQRSKGYLARRTLTVEEINEVYKAAKSISNAFVVVDNCYGEFVETKEPTADLIIGSLIKNAGGGIAECGGYLAGTAEAVELASYRLTVPGVGREGGASLGQTKNMLKGLFLAPHAVAQAIKTAHFAAALFEKLGYNVMPKPLEKRSCLIQTIDLCTKEKMLAFCRGLQAGSPIDSFVEPVGWAMPGYDCEVVMAAGAFTQGSSIELSADGPLEEPYRIYLQGGLTYESGKYGVLRAAEEVLNV